MPHIYDNILLHLLPDLQAALNAAYRADFCVGYFNLRGWRALGPAVEAWPGCEGSCVRLLVGMQRLPQDELRQLYAFSSADDTLDNATIIRLKRKLAQDFRDQLTIGAPTDADEAALRQLARQIKAKQVIVKLFLSHPLHAKLYLLHRHDRFNPIIAYLGSSNLTMAGLSHQGELNVDVLDGDAGQKLANWFEDRWNEFGCVDISDELVKIIDESWAREELIPPYHIYLKMAYHLAEEAHEGLREFSIPRIFGNRLFEFQVKAVKIAAHHLNKRGGVLIGDVVGLGKTLMATAVASIMEEQGLETLIICPKNLVKMWESYVHDYRLHAQVLSLSRVLNDLDDLRRYRVLILDESHNLRNREGRRYHAIRDYIQRNECRCILLSATPYNKSYLDLSSQLGLFLSPDQELGIRPERAIREVSEVEFIRKHQCSTRTLAAFEFSEYPEDWRELMRLYMIRRTRSFIMANYAFTDPTDGRKYLLLADGSSSYFPNRTPKKVTFTINDNDPQDQYARLYADDVVDTINTLNLPRYGLALYLKQRPQPPSTPAEDAIISDLSRAGRRMMGFCRTGLFKRLESSGAVFLESLNRHILRNELYLYALEHNLPLPIGTQDAGLLDTTGNDEDIDRPDFIDDLSPGADEPAEEMIREPGTPPQREVAAIYQQYASTYKNRFKWLAARLFGDGLAAHLRSDNACLRQVLAASGAWRPERDTKLAALLELVSRTHPRDKVVIFTQFADTVNYLVEQLLIHGVSALAGATGGSADPTEMACRFSPHSNEVQIAPAYELRVLVSTDLLSEGQNLQDGHIIVNYDLPWAIIRLIQRAGRVDRIGQQSPEILCYSFITAEGVERILNLRARLRQRLKDNAEVVGSDEDFFEGEKNERLMQDLYNEKANLLDDEDDTEIDLVSYAYQIWKNAIDQDPTLAKIIPALPAVVYSSKQHAPTHDKPAGVLVYARTASDNDALAWVDTNGRTVTGSQYDILRAAECKPETPALTRQANHHDLVQRGVAEILVEEKQIGGQLGRPSGARFRTYERLKRYAQAMRGTLFASPELERAIEEIYRYPLREVAKDTLNRQLRAGISDKDLAKLVTELRAEGRLCKVEEEVTEGEPTLICSLGLVER